MLLSAVMWNVPSPIPGQAATRRMGYIHGWVRPLIPYSVLDRSIYGWVRTDHRSCLHVEPSVLYSRYRDGRNKLIDFPSTREKRVVIQ